MNGALVDWPRRPRARAVPRPALRHLRLRGHPCLRRRRAGRPSSDCRTTSPGSSDRPRCTTCRIPYTREELRAAIHQIIGVQRARRLLHPPDRPAGLRHHGPVPARGARGRGHRGVAVGRLPRRGGPAKRHPGQDLELAAHRLHTIPATAKAGGQYLNSILAKIETHKAGYQEAILLNDAGYRGRRLRREHLRRAGRRRCITPPPPGLDPRGHHPRHDHRRWPRDEGIPVQEREIARGELYTADEVFITGTAAEVCPVNEVDDHPARPARARHAAACRSASSRPPRAATRGPPSGSTTWTPRRRPPRRHRMLSASSSTTPRSATGMQREGLSLTVGEQLAVAVRLADFGVEYLEAGFPASNPKYGELFRLLEREDLRRHAPRGLRHDAPPRDAAPTTDPAHARPGRELRAGHHDRRQDLGPPHREGHPGLPRGEPADDRGVGRLPRPAGQGGRLRRGALLRRVRRPPRLRARLPPGRRGRRRHLDHAVRHQRRHAARPRRAGRCARCGRRCPGVPSASTPTTTPSARWPTASPPSTRARAWCRARSTATASAAATRTSSRSSRRSP